MAFQPKLVIFRENALEYPLGQEIMAKLKKEKVETKTVSARGPFNLEQGLDFQQHFLRSKRIMVVSVRSLSSFQSCKPSAHYQLPLVSGCPAHCQYCYLNTNLGKSPYIRVYVNIEEILARAENYMEERKPEVTIFEGSATSDPLPVEKYTGSLARTIAFFARKELGCFRFVTKFNEVDSLLGLDHRGKTEFRFSLNSRQSIEKFEPTTPPVEERVEAAGRVFRAGYPMGFLIAPIFIYEGWQEEYEDLIHRLQQSLASNGRGISFELITHRFTDRAKEVIEKVYPRTELPMNEEAREFKYGQFGYGKYVYPAETREELENFFKEKLTQYLPEAEIKYFV